MWKSHRAMTRPFFSREHRAAHFDIFEEHAEDAIDQMRMRMRAGYAVNFQVHALPIYDFYIILTFYWNI